jgi:plastocyanin
MTRRVLTALLLITIVITGCSSGKKSSSASSSSSGSAAAASNTAPVIKNFEFSPNAIHVKVGQKVTWTNEDGTDHTVQADNNSFGSGHLATGQTFSYTFTKPGTYTYHCAIHNYMTGTVIVQ